MPMTMPAAAGAQAAVVDSATGLGFAHRWPVEIPLPRGRKWASIAIEFESTGAGLLGLYVGSDRIVQLCGIPKSGRKTAIIDLRMERAEADRLNLIASLLLSSAGRPSSSAARYIELSLERDAAMFSPDILCENIVVLSLNIVA